MLCCLLYTAYMFVVCRSLVFLHFPLLFGGERGSVEKEDEERPSLSPTARAPSWSEIGYQPVKTHSTRVPKSCVFTTRASQETPQVYNEVWCVDSSWEVLALQALLQESWCITSVRFEEFDVCVSPTKTAAMFYMSRRHLCPYSAVLYWNGGKIRRVQR